MQITPAFIVLIPILLQSASALPFSLKNAEAEVETLGKNALASAKADPVDTAVTVGLDVLPFVLKERDVEIEKRSILTSVENFGKGELQQAEAHPVSTALNVGLDVLPFVLKE